MGEEEEGKGTRRQEGGRKKEERDMEKDQKYSPLVPQPGNFIMFIGGAGGVRKGMPNKIA